MEPTVFKALGLHQSWEDLHPRDFRVNGRANVEIDEVLRTAEDRQYNPCPEAYLGGPLDGVVSVFDDSARLELPVAELCCPWFP